MPGNTSMAVAPAAGAGEPGSGSGETARHAAPRGAGCPSYELLSKYRGVLMGVQILLIMAFHYTEDLSNAADHFNGPAQVFYDYIGSSGVDMFLMISGLGLYYSWKRNPDAGGVLPQAADPRAGAVRRRGAGRVDLVRLRPFGCRSGAFPRRHRIRHVFSRTV